MKFGTLKADGTMELGVPQDLPPNRENGGDTCGQQHQILVVP